MPRLQRKSFLAPDEVRTFPNGRMDVVRLDETPVARFVFQPGWRWSRDVAPMTGARSCAHRHVGYTISGKLGIRMDDGTELVIGPDEAYEIPPGHDGWVIGDEPWTAIEFTSAHSYGASPGELGERVLATIVFSDIVNSTTVLERLGDRAWTNLLHEHNVRIRAAIDRYLGREMGTTGDGFLALFDGAAKAANAALLMSSSVAELGLSIRIGIHTGEVEIVGGQARGVAVHAAARVAALAGAGEILVSGMTHDLLEGSDLSFESRGVHELKGLSGARPIFALNRTSPSDVSLD
jgi:class 3 adenylate cyclase